MSEMEQESLDIYSEILVWSQDRPSWQRDALRRLFSGQEPGRDDIGDLAELCKADKGLSAARSHQVLAADHLSIHNGGSEVVSLISLTHHQGANALAPEQTVEFGPNLTVIYGANAAGKSGYSRILKRACRSRFSEEVLGNVLSGEAPARLGATIRFRVGSATSPAEWKTDFPPSPALSAVSVFDAASAPVYLRDRTDVAFRPFGLDVFDKLSAICGEVRSLLEAEKARIGTVTAGLPMCPEGTQVKAIIDNLTSLTDTDGLRALATLSADELRRLGELRTQQRDLQASDPRQRARELKMKADRLDLASRHLANLASTFGKEEVDRLRLSFDSLRAAKEALAVVRESALTADVLPHTGEDEWRRMWEAGKAFSAAALPESVFPVLTEGARCPFCQQEIGREARERLTHFAEYVSSNAQTRVKEAEEVHHDLVLKAGQLTVGRADVELALTELAEDNTSLAQRVRDFLSEAERIQKEIAKAVREGGALPVSGIEQSPEADLRAGEAALRERARQLGAEIPAMEPSVAAELRELEARVTLGERIEAVLSEIDRKKRIAAYDQCLAETLTQAITRKSTELTTRLVTDRLRAVFQDELVKLDFRHLDIEIQAAGGERGALYHRLVFTNAPGVPVIRVLSEGESRTLSLAAFLTELSTAPSRSAIIFDDPVSSLDHEWRQRIANRLVAEAQVRQVIVFTHDILFLSLLLDQAKHEGVSVQNQFVRRDGQAGLCSSDLPWIALSVRDRIGKLRNRWQTAEKLHRTSPGAYEPEAQNIYGLLRETWEQAVPEVLLNDVVERYRHSIETKKVRHLHDITSEDCRTVEDAMTECSKWMLGHSQPAADGTPFPRPDELWKQIDVLDTWTKAIRKRRGG